ncbi:MAG: hypothetical protein HY292_20600 [Planctomycetes bacterium]|nr:hypothetical protein [Planctomycetota bacterium]
MDRASSRTPSRTQRRIRAIVAKKRQQFPIIFAGGNPDKLQATRDKFPKARFCSTHSILTTIGKMTQP